MPTTITTLVGSDGITTANTMTKVNANFDSLNTNKIETSYIDIDTTLAANSDVKIPSQRAVKAYVDSGGQQNGSETVRGLVEEATDAEVTAETATGGSGAKLFVTPAKLATRLASVFKFGGTGADGALTITSGATNIDLAGATHVTKNYSSISITGTGSLTFTNPADSGTVITLKCSGAVTITSSASPTIDLRSLGGIPGDGSVTNLTNGVAGAAGNCNMLFSTGAGGAGAGNATTIATAGARVGVFYATIPKTIIFGCGAGGGGGGKGNGGSASGGGGGASINTNGTSFVGAINVDANGANGGRGAGCIYIECAGALNITGIINASGAAGSSAGGTGAGGGGGGGGSVIILYGSLTDNSGTYTVTGGSAGTGEVNGGAGGLGYSLVAANTEFA